MTEANEKQIYRRRRRLNKKKSLNQGKKIKTDDRNEKVIRGQLLGRG
jgi:hypothetical protein